MDPDKGKTTDKDPEPFMLQFREFVPLHGPDDALPSGGPTPTEFSTGTAGREDEYDAP